MNRNVTTLFAALAALLMLSACGPALYAANAVEENAGETLAQPPAEVEVVPYAGEPVEPSSGDLRVLDQLLTPTVKVETVESGEVKMTLGLYNGGPHAFSSDDFNGAWELKTEDGTPRASGDVWVLPEVAVSQESVPVAFTGTLEPGGYILTWQAPSFGSMLVTFTVEEAEDGSPVIGDVFEHSTSTYPLPEGMEIPG